MPKINWPSEEESRKYVQKMRERRKQLSPDEYRGFFPIDKKSDTEREAAFGRLSSAMYSYILQTPNGLSKDERSRLHKPDTPLSLSSPHSYLLTDQNLAHLLDLKCLLESTAENGRTHFENMVDFAYASNISAKYLAEGIKAMREDLCMDLQVPELRLDRVSNPKLQGRDTERKNGLEWISEFKADASHAVAAKEKEPDTDWIINTLAVRSLLRSERHKSDKLKGQLLGTKEITDRANRLMADPGVRGYIDELKHNPREYERAAELLQKGNGGRLEDQLTAYMVAKNKISYSTLGSRYRPTAKQLIEMMQGTLNNKESSLEKKQEALASIIGVRKFLSVHRAKMGLVGDDALKQQLKDYAGFQTYVKESAEALKDLPAKNQLQLMSDACSGHGGAMVQKFDKMLLNPVRTQAEREQARHPVLG